MTPTVLPRPTSLVERPGRFVVAADLVIAAAPGLESVAGLLAARLRTATGYPVPLGTPSRGIDLRLDADLAAEAYRLDISPDGVLVVGGDRAGVFHGTQTLLQLFPAEVFGATACPGVGWEIPCVLIDDRPRFGWRGLLVDCSRHFFGKAHLLRIIDALALHHGNVLHLHLTDDQGWRIEIPGYPRLTEKGAWRPRSAIGDTSELPPGATVTYDPTPHGGFFTRAELAEIVRYAAERHITVLPEIDLPGHVQAALASYPELGNTDRPVDVWTDWGISPHVLNLSDATLGFCRDVLTEVMAVVPGRYVHVGGDECPTQEWAASAAAQQRMRELGLSDERALQGWFTSRLAEHLAAHGRRLVGWDELLDAPPPDGATIMAWQDEAAGVRAARAGYDVVMAPYSHTYLYRAQTADRAVEPIAAQPPLTLAEVYDYDPMPAGLDEQAAGRILGAQCSLWTEFVLSPMQFERALFPRMCAFAETVWCTERDSLAGFTGRLRPQLDRLAALGIASFPDGG